MFERKLIYKTAKISALGLGVAATFVFFLSGENTANVISNNEASTQAKHELAAPSKSASTPVPALPVNRYKVVTEATTSDIDQVKEFDQFMQRYNSGDSATVAKGTVSLESELMSLIERSPTATIELGARFRDAVAKGDLSSLLVLERVLSMTNAGIAEMIPGFTKEIVQGGPNTPYAFQQIAQLQSFMDDKTKADVFNAALTQMVQARDLNEYGGAQNYLVLAAAEDSTGAVRQQAIQAITERGQRAQTDEEHFFAAYNVYRLSNPEQAAQLARQNLAQSFNAGSINAVITGIRDGTVAYDSRLMSQISSAIRLGNFSEQQLGELSTAMTSLQRGQGG